VIFGITIERWQVFKISHNVLHIAEGGEYEAQNLNLKQMFNRSTTVHFSTKPPLLAICCYVPFFFTNLN
jgi:hypothetical protein